MKNNKGFSLVELIIVIAIMAVLVGVLAPTYMQYVEKSKKSNDVSTVDTIVNAIEIAAIDPETQSDDWKRLEITITSTGMTIEEFNVVSGGTKDAAAAANMTNAVTKITGTDVKFKNNWGGDVKFTATKGDYGTVTFTWNTSVGKTADFKKYATSITKIS